MPCCRDGPRAKPHSDGLKQKPGRGPGRSWALYSTWVSVYCLKDSDSSYCAYFSVDKIPYAMNYPSFWKIYLNLFQKSPSPENSEMVGCGNLVGCFPFPHRCLFARRAILLHCHICSVCKQPCDGPTQYLLGCRMTKETQNWTVMYDCAFGIPWCIPEVKRRFFV